jgi:pectate lyase
MFRKALYGAALVVFATGAYAATDYPSGYTKCAKDGATCAFTGTRSVAYGKAGTFVYATLTGPINCTASLFPATSVATPRYCSYAAAGSGSSSSTSSSSTSSSSTSSSSSSSSTSSSSSSSSGGTPGNAGGVSGFAALNRDGRNGTNGGAGGSTADVSTFAALVAAVGDNTPRIVQIHGTISGSGMVKVGSNKTIFGIGANATISGFGLDVNSWTQPFIDQYGDTCDANERSVAQPVQNVIIRNISFRNANDDSINVQCWAHHVWIDHNTFYPAADGSVDIKRGSDWATVSWNRFVGTDKSMLLGHSDDVGTLDRGRLHATYHHNWFDHSNTRHPRVRFGQAHVYNNYANGITDYFMGKGVECSIYADGNYVDAIKRIFTPFDGTNATWTNTNMIAGECRAPDCLVFNNGAFNPASYYSWSPDNAANVPSIVMNGAGAGRL